MSYFMYNIIIFLYNLGVIVASCFSEKVRKMRKGELAAFGYLKANVDPNAKYIWFHAASLGEFEQGRPMMEYIRKQHPEYKILLTFFSPSGYEVRKDYAGADLICYLPIDTSHGALMFLHFIRPVMAFFIKYEFWWNYLHILKYLKIPVYSMSSIFRDGQIFFRWYGKEYSKVLKCFTHLYVQNEKSKELLEKIGVKNVTIVGDTRFDRVLDITKNAKKLPLIETFINNSPVLVVGSSWPGDEDVIFPCPCKLIVAPHNVSDDRINNIISKCHDKKVVCYSQVEQSGDMSALAEADVLIIDCYGILSSVYGYGTVTFVGGGFDHTGIHNVLEAAVWEKPVLYGPNYHEYQEGEELIASGGGIELHNAEEFRNVMNELLSDKKYLNSVSVKSANYVKSKTGATRRIIEHLGL